MNAILNSLKKYFPDYHPEAPHRVRLLFSAFLLFFLAAAFQARATTYTSIDDGDWKNKNNWSPKGIPDATDDVYINGHDIVISQAQRCASLTFNAVSSLSSLTIYSGSTLSVGGAVLINNPARSGQNSLIVGDGTLTAGSLTVAGATPLSGSLVEVGNGTLSVAGNIAFNSGNSSFLNITGAGVLKVGGNLGPNGALNLGASSTVYFNGTTSQNLPVTYLLPNVIIQNAGGVKLAGNTDATIIDGNLSVTQGFLDTDGYSLTGASGASLTVENGAALRLSGSSSFPTGYATISLKSLSEVIYQGNNQVVAARGYGQLTLKNSGTTKTMTGNCVISGNLVLDDDVTLEMNKNQISGNGAAIINGYVKTNHPNGLAGANGAFTCIGGITLSPTSTVDYSSAGAQLITPRNDYKNLIISNVGEKSVNGNITIGGNLSVNTSATLNIGAYQILSAFGSNASILIKGIVRTSRTEGFSGSTRTAIHRDVSPITLANGSTIVYNASGGGTQVISSRSDYKNITLSGSRVKALQGNITIAGKLTVDEDAYFRFDGYQVQEASGANATAQINGVVEVTNATGLAGKTTTALHANITLLPLAETSNVIYNATWPQVVTALDYGGLTIENSGQKNLEGNLVIRGFLLVNEIATLDLNSYQVAQGAWVLNRPYIAINGVVRTARSQGFSGSDQTSITNEFQDIWLNTSSTIVYYGANQLVSARNDYGKVLLEGGQTKVLSGTASVYTELDLSGGSLDLGNHSLIIEAFGEVTNASSNFYVIQSGTGRMLVKNLGTDNGGNSDEVLFPIGTKDSYNPVYITNTGSNNSFSVVVNTGVVDNAGQPATYGVVNRTWNIKKETNNGTPNITLKLQWNPGDEATDFDRNNCAISYYQPGGGWTWVTTFKAASGGGPYFATATGLANLSSFGVGNQVSPLPVELVYFKVTKKGESALLEWETAMERNNRGFEVQLSADGKTFEQIGFVESRNPNSQAPQHYTFTDPKESKTGLWYYRIKQTDLDGTVSFFGPKVIDFGKAVNQIAAYPNPFTDQFLVKLETAAAAEALITLQDLSGKTVYQQHEKLNAGSNDIPVKIGDQFPAGLYVLTAKAGSQVYTLKLIKQ